jgi:hypothetical protein
MAYVMGSIKRQWEKEFEATMSAAFHAFKESDTTYATKEGAIREFMASPYFDGGLSLTQLECILIGREV